MTSGRRVRSGGGFVLPLLLALLGPGLGAEATEAPKAPAAKSGDKVTISVEQARQIVVSPVASRALSMVKPGIGQIAFNEEASTVVLAPFSGRVTKLHAKVGDVLRKGEPLFELESPEVVQAQTDLIAAVQGLSKARSQLAVAKRALSRQSALIGGNATSQRDLDLAKNDHEAAEADIKTAEGALKAARNKLRVIIGRSEAEVAQIEEERAINPSITIHAPIGGTVVSRKIGPGQYVRSDVNEPLLAIADLSTMWLKASVPENDIPLIRVGQEMEIKVSALAERVFRTRVTAIGSSSDSTTRRVIVRSEIPNADGVLKAEMFAQFRIFTGTGEKGPVVPAEAVVWDGNDTVVWLQTEPRVFQRRKIRISREQDGVIEVAEGLKAGEAVASRGAIFIDNEWKQ